MKLLITDDPNALKELEFFFDGKIDAFLVDGSGFFKYKPSIVPISDFPHTDAPCEIVRVSNSSGTPLFYDSFCGGWITLEEKGWGGDNLVSFSYGVKDRQELYEECIIYCKKQFTSIGACFQIIELFDMTLGVPRVLYGNSDSGLDSLTPWDDCRFLKEGKKRRESLLLLRYWWESNLLSLLADVLGKSTCLPNLSVEDGLVIGAINSLDGCSSLSALESALGEMFDINGFDLALSPYQISGVRPMLEALVSEGLILLTPKGNVCLTELGSMCKTLCDGVSLVSEYGRLSTNFKGDPDAALKTWVREMFGGYLQKSRLI